MGKKTKQPKQDDKLYSIKIYDEKGEVKKEFKDVKDSSFWVQCGIVDIIFTNGSHSIYKLIAGERVDIPAIAFDETAKLGNDVTSQTKEAIKQI